MLIFEIQNSLYSFQTVLFSYQFFQAAERLLGEQNEQKKKENIKE